MGRRQTSSTNSFLHALGPRRLSFRRGPDAVQPLNASQESEVLNVSTQLSAASTRSRNQLRAFRAVRFSLGGIFVLVAIVTGLHLPAGRSILRILGGGCPIGQASAFDVEVAQKAALAAEAAHLPSDAPLAKTRSMFGFTLGETTFEQVRFWAREHNVSCAEKREMTVIECQHVMRSELPLPSEPSFDLFDELSFTFDLSTHRLRDISGYRFHLVGKDAQSYADLVRASALRSLGEPTLTRGDWTFPAQGQYQTAIVRYRFRDLVGDVTVTCLPGGTTVQQRFGLYPGA
jgi:hypothetical protein